MKKFFSWFIVLSIVMSMTAPVFASNETELQTALTDVKERLNIGDFENFESSHETDENGNTRYYFYWSQNNEDDYEYISVAYQNGVITSYDRSVSGEYSYTKGFPKYSPEDAKKTAEEFIKKANPDCFENIKITKNEVFDLNGNSYYFNLIREENSIPVINQDGNIAVSKNTNEVRYFNISYDTDIEFESTEALISEEIAKESYAKNLAPKLQYAYTYDYKTKELKVYSEYISNDRNFVINAKDANVYELPDMNIYYKGSGAMNAEEAAATADTSLRLSEAELLEVSNIAGLMSEAEAEKSVRKNEVLKVPSELKLSRISLQRDYMNKDKYRYNINFSGENGYLFADINAKTGEILSFSKSGKYPEKQNQNLLNEQKKADDAFRKLAVEKYSNFKLEETENTGHIAYIRMHDGIKVNGDTVTFNFDGEDNLIGYNISYTDIKEFPSLDGILSEEQAFYSACKLLDFKLSYSIDYKTKKATPVYCFLDGARTRDFRLDPFTGRLTDYKGDEITEDNKIYEYSDIENHYAKGKFLKLAEFGIGFSGGTLQPDKPITQAEYLTLLNAVFGYNGDIDEIYTRFIQNDTVEQRDDNSEVTRETASIMMIREMGAEEFAKYNDIYTSPFNDVTENKGYVSLLKAMGVVSGDPNGNFNPHKTITRAEALIIIFNYLNR